MIDLFFVSDVIVNFHTGYVKEGRYINEPKDVAVKYLKSG
tara:strand:+ start:455 stop:574 length:120 start_codon:yes stop_codon:yes gene_type:complete